MREREREGRKTGKVGSMCQKKRERRKQTSESEATRRGRKRERTYYLLQVREIDEWTTMRGVEGELG